MTLNLETIYIVTFSLGALISILSIISSYLAYYNYTSWNKTTCINTSYTKPKGDMVAANWSISGITLLTILILPIVYFMLLKKA